MSTEARIIILEHIPTDAELFELQLRKGNLPCSTKRVSTKEQFLRLIQEFAPIWSSRTSACRGWTLSLPWSLHKK